MVFWTSYKNLNKNLVILKNYIGDMGFLGGSAVKTLPAMPET